MNRTLQLHSIQVEHFRNLLPFTFTPGKGANIIAGNNAQGKTNLLEAIWLFTGSRSFRGARDKDYLQIGKEYAGLQLEFSAGGRPQSASIRYGENKRVIQLNEITETSYSAFSGVFCAVLFSPDHLSLIKDGPEGRRQMLDSSLSQAYPKYTKALENYGKALRQRNRLLKDIPMNASLKELLPLWDQHIIDYGGYVSALRARYVRQLAQHAKMMYEGISGGTEQFSLRYQPSFGKELESLELEECKYAVEQALTAAREQDIRFGSTSIGPHRDDLEILVDGLDARTFSSQGQQRSAVLALKLAESEILEEQNGEAPIIMLDDVMSELDQNRRDYLLNKIEGKQVFITCCDDSAFCGLKEGTIFVMKNGVLRRA